MGARRCWSCVDVRGCCERHDRNGQAVVVDSCKHTTAETRRCLSVCKSRKVNDPMEKIIICVCSPCVSQDDSMTTFCLLTFLLLLVERASSGIVAATIGTRGPSSSDESYLTLLDSGTRSISLLSAGSCNKFRFRFGYKRLLLLLRRIVTRARQCMYLCMRVCVCASTGDIVESLYNRTTPMRLVGNTDGVGAFVDELDPRHFVLFVHHELTRGSGAVRAHGQRGAFVSRFVIDRRTLRVVAGDDMVQSASNVHLLPSGAAAFSFFCSADIPAPSALYDSRTARGTTDRIFFGGEEDFNGRALAWVATGAMANNVFELERFGHARIENVVLTPFEQELTIAALSDDNTPGFVGIYVGTKTARGSPIARAGLTNGLMYYMRVKGLGSESTASTPSPSTFDLVPAKTYLGTPMLLFRVACII